MRETLGVLLGFFLAAVLGYLISEIAQKEQEKEVLESYMDSLQEIYEVIRQRMDVTRKFRHDLLSHVQTLEYLIENGFNPEHLVVERNYEIIPKEQFASVTIQDEDVIEVLRFVGGG